jgi:flagellar FliL protein
LSETAEIERKPKGVLPLVLVAVLTLVVGGGAGLFVVGPLMGGGAVEAAAEHGEEEGAAEAEGGHGESSGSTNYSIENLVVNPAGTQGTRFLIVSLTIIPDNAATLARLTERDAEIRDTLLQVLAGKTIQDLSDLTQRESVKEEIRAAAEGVVKPGKIRRIFMPQFVLQ